MKKRKVKQPRKPRSRVWVLITILASAVVLAVVVGAIVSSPTAEAQQESSRQQPQVSDDDATVEFANQRITIDARTGRLRKPTVEEARALVETITSLTDRSSKGLRVERRPDGTRRVDLQGRFKSVVLAKPSPDGTNEIRCVTSMAEAAAFLGIDPAKIPAPASKEAPNAK
ncbi:MAG: hypothetical protein WAU45_10780 [Blastocatellia bacterium]